QLIRTLADDGVSGQHVVQRGEFVGATLAQENAEVLRVAIRGTQHPEEDLGLEERAAVAVRSARRAQQLHDLAHTRSAVGLVLQMRRNCRRLAHVFLRSPDERSEERRVGKEWRRSGALYHLQLDRLSLAKHPRWTRLETSVL